MKGLRREEVAILAGVSVDYYVRLERGNLAGASDSVLDALATTLQLDDAEREYLHDLARASGPGLRRATRPKTSVRPAVQQVLDAISDVPAWVRNGRHDIIAANRLARALYSPVFDDPHRPVNTTRFAYLNPAAREFWRDYDQITHDSRCPQAARIVGGDARGGLRRRRRGDDEDTDAGEEGLASPACGSRHVAGRTVTLGSSLRHPLFTGRPSSGRTRRTDCPPRRSARPTR